MTKVSFKDSAIYATRGLFGAISTERNIKIQLFIGAVIIFISVLLGISKVYLITIIIVIFLVVILEMFNRGFEKLIDLISPEYSKEARKIKDAMAGVVLATFALAMIVSLLVLYQPLITFFKIISEHTTSLAIMIADILLSSIILLSYYIKKVNHTNRTNQKAS
jgi:diacylglycerol kinase